MAARPLILTVDDDELSRYAIAQILRRGEYRVVEARTAAEAYEQLALERPALIVLDINLPDANGIDVCRRLKADPATSRLPVLQVSASRIAIEDQVAGLDGGADGYLTWPTDPHVLLATTRALLRARDAEATAALLGTEWQATVNATRDGILVLDARNRIVRANRRAAHLLGMTVDDLVGLDLPTLLDPEAAHGIGDRLHDALTGARNAAFELPLGATWQLVSVDPIADDGGVVRGVVLVLADITERRAADAIRDTFIGVLSHELRTPVTTILGGSRVLESRTDLPVEVRTDLVADITAEAERLHRLVEDLLVLARAERGVAMSMADPILLQHVIRKVVESEQRLEPSMRITTRVPGLPTASGDGAYAEQVLRNLISNAAKYGEGGEIDIAAHAGGDGITVTVRDHGPGIDREDEPRLFDLFYRGASTERSAKGAGIGLFVCRELVRAMGGDIWVSRPEGGGTAFSFRLPLYDETGPVTIA